MALTTQTFNFNDQSRFMMRDFSVKFTFDPHAPEKTVVAHDLSVNHSVVLPNLTFTGSMVPYDHTTTPKITSEVNEALENLFKRSRAAGGVDSAYLATDNWVGWKTIGEKFISKGGPIGRDEGLARAVPQVIADMTDAAKLVAKAIR